MSKMKELEQVAEFMATTAKETLMQNAEWAIDGTSSVSYTHLTLPTNREV